MKSKKLRAAVASASLFLTAAAVAHTGATGVVKDRMDLMDRIGDANEELAKIMRGRVDYDADRVRELAEIIASHGGEAMTQVFPAGSISGPSEAVPAIWDEWERFSSLAAELADYAEALVAAADNPRVKGRGMPSGGGMASGGMMDGGMSTLPGPVELSTLPPDAAFLRVAQTCSTCHQDYRKSGR